MIDAFIFFNFDVESTIRVSSIRLFVLKEREVYIINVKDTFNLNNNITITYLSPSKHDAKRFKTLPDS